MKKYIFFVGLALFIIVIASNMSYKQQTIIPELQTLLANKPFEEQLSKIHLTYWGRPISVETRGYFYFVEFLIRKGTHFVGYGIVGLLFYVLYRKVAWKVPALIAILTVFFIASLDELRQTFIPGRTGVFSDVMLDTSGAICFIFLVKIIRTLKNRVSI